MTMYIEDNGKMFCQTGSSYITVTNWQHLFVSSHPSCSLTCGPCSLQRSNSIKKTRELQEDFVQQAESQLELFKQNSQSFSDTASRSALNAAQTSSQGPALPMKQPPQRAPAPTTRHLRQILRSRSAKQVGPTLQDCAPWECSYRHSYTMPKHKSFGCNT